MGHHPQRQSFKIILATPLPICGMFVQKYGSVFRLIVRIVKINALQKITMDKATFIYINILNHLMVGKKVVYSIFFIDSSANDVLGDFLLFFIFFFFFWGP